MCSFLNRVYKYLKERQQSCASCQCVSRVISWIASIFHKSDDDSLDISRWQISYAPYPDDINWYYRNVALNHLLTKYLITGKIFLSTLKWFGWESLGFIYFFSSYSFSFRPHLFFSKLWNLLRIRNLLMKELEKL